MLETYILIRTSFFMTTYHCLIKTDERHLYLNCRILYSFAFMILAVWEIINSNARRLHNPHSAACFLTIGLHFIHVIIGTVGLTELDYYDRSKLVRRYRKIIILYWHFVDYIWLFVYLIVLESYKILLLLVCLLMKINDCHIVFISMMALFVLEVSVMLIVVGTKICQGSLRISIGF
ncbi:hypothetical protein MN116_000309 [Schistosoma mekongi]|uniref:Heme-copper oxidase subunit III family profile domain-containing protein n=1 Tax=Schistosoma mekongi TaxID=38744 RepID=A0AAE1Z5N0_SCHME|nr:hypothetical protein MN116_000309 [Schistosoma mekongi]